MSATFSRRRSHTLAALAFVAFTALHAFAPGAHAATVPLLDEFEQSVRADGGAMRDLNLQAVADIRQQLKAGEPVPAWALAGLVSKLTAECEHEVVRQPERALRKIALTLRLIDAWQDRSENWLPHLRMDQGKVLLLRWFLQGDPADRDRAHRLYAAIDEAETDAKDRGRAAYHLGAEYEELAGHARDLGRGRDEQIALILTGIQINKAGRAKYPDYDSSVGLNALYAQLQFVSGGSALPAHLDDWAGYMATQPADVQGRSGEALADALFLQGRDEEALSWMRRYAAHWARATPPAQLEAGLRKLRCGMLDLDLGFLQFARRQQRQSDEIRAAICEGKPLPETPAARPGASAPTTP